MGGGSGGGPQQDRRGLHRVRDPQRRRVTVVGTTDQVNGNATVADQKLTSAEVVVQVAGIATDNARRDGQFRGNVMDTENFPTAVFRLTTPVDLATLPTDGTAATVKADGTLTLKDQTRPVSVDVKVLHTATRWSRPARCRSRGRTTESRRRHWDS